MSIELDDLKLSFCDWLYLKDDQIIDIVAGAVIANQFEGPDSFNLDIVGPASSTKTEILRSLNKHKLIYTASTLTPQTLISGMKSSSASLLTRLKEEGKKILIVKDLTTILEMRSESRQEILSQIREVADGYCSKDFGTGRRVSWEGKLGFICGVTPLIDQHHGHNQMLGERFLFCRVTNDDPYAMAKKAKQKTGKEIKMREELSQTMNQFLEQFEGAKIKDIDILVDTDEKLTNLACFLAQGRTGVSRDRYTRTIEYMPEPEGTARISKQLWVLGAGIATVQGKKVLDEDVYRILRRVVENSLPRHRGIILRRLWESMITSEDWAVTKTIGEMVQTPTDTTKRYLEDLWVCNLLDRRIEGEDDEDNFRSNTKPYQWKLSKIGIDLIEKSEIFLSNGQPNENGDDHET